MIEKWACDLLLLALCELEASDQLPESRMSLAVDEPLRPARFPMEGRVWECPTEGLRSQIGGGPAVIIGGKISSSGPRRR